MKKKKENENEEDIEEGLSEEKPALQASETKFAVARRVIRQLKQQLENLETLLESEDAGDMAGVLDRQGEETDELLGPLLVERVIDGVFDGEQMVGEDGKKYPVPANYASKSKLVEGDLLRLTINGRGRFLFKQKGPIERQRLIGTLIQDENTQDWLAVADGRKFHVLPAAISYFKGEPNDQIVILVPRNAPSHWAAVENVIKD